MEKSIEFDSMEFSFLRIVNSTLYHSKISRYPVLDIRKANEKNLTLSPLLAVM